MSNGHGHRSNWTREHPNLAASLPFQRRSGPGGGISIPRILEAVVIALLAAFLTSLMTFAVTQAVIETKLHGIERTLEEIKDEQRRMRNDLYQPRFNRGAMAGFPDGND